MIKTSLTFWKSKLVIFLMIETVFTSEVGNTAFGWNACTAEEDNPAGFHDPAGQRLDGVVLICSQDNLSTFLTMITGLNRAVCRATGLYRPAADRINKYKNLSESIITHSLVSWQDYRKFYKIFYKSVNCRYSDKKADGKCKKSGKALFRTVKKRYNDINWIIPGGRLFVGYKLKRSSGTSGSSYERKTDYA